MKKFIATILSAMVGMFGYTLVDSAVEDRISKLETEIVELREELSEKSETGKTSDVLEVGDYIEISPASFDKLLLRENENGEWKFISPGNIDQVKDDDIFVCLTDVTCQITGFEDVTFNIEKGKNYEPDSVVLKLPVLSASFKGYTSPSLSGKQLTFSAGLGTISIQNVPVIPFESASCIVSSDGSFSFNAGLSLSGNSLFESMVSMYYLEYGKEYAEKLSNEIITSQLFLGFGVYGLTVS